MKAAFVMKEVAPKDPFYLMGYVGPAREHPAQGIHDVTQVNTVVFQLSGENYLLSVADVIAFTLDKSDQIKKELQEKYAIKPEHASIIALHTHSGPNGTAGGLGPDRDNDAYFTDIKKAVLDSAGDALCHLKEITPMAASLKIQGCFSNRNRLGDPYDDEVQILKFVDGGNQAVGAILNIACHSTVLGPANMMLSGDLLGAVRNKMAAHLDMPMLTVMGAAGDTSNRQYRQGDDFTELERISTEVFNQLKALTDFKPLTMEPASVKTLEYVIDYENAQYYDGYRRLMAELQEKLEDPQISKVQHKLYASSIAQLEDKLQVGHVHKVVYNKIYSFGDFQIVTFGGELSGKLGLQLKAKNPEKFTMVITCADSHGGYFIEKEQYGKFYETIATDNPIGEPEKIIKQIEDEL